jgi:hypothetical protein
MLYISICITLLTILAAAYYLNRVKSENLGIIHKLAAWLVMITAGLILVCQIARGINIMMRCSSEGCAASEHCVSMGEGRHHNSMIVTKEVRKMRGGHCGDGAMKNLCCGSGECKGVGECGGKCEEGMSCCMDKNACCESGSEKGSATGQHGSKMDCCNETGACCGSGECKGTGNCKGNCMSGMGGHHAGKKTKTVKDTVVIRK